MHSRRRIPGACSRSTGTEPNALTVAPREEQGGSLISDVLVVEGGLVVWTLRGHLDRDVLEQLVQSMDEVFRLQPTHLIVDLAHSEALSTEVIEEITRHADSLARLLIRMPAVAVTQQHSRSVA